ncbi:unnamed protein product [Diplocarpon coronariae]
MESSFPRPSPKAADRAALPSWAICATDSRMLRELCGDDSPHRVRSRVQTAPWDERDKALLSRPSTAERSSNGRESTAPYRPPAAGSRAGCRPGPRAGDTGTGSAEASGRVMRRRGGTGTGAGQTSAVQRTTGRPALPPGRAPRLSLERQARGPCPAEASCCGLQSRRPDSSRPAVGAASNLRNLRRPVILILAPRAWCSCVPVNPAPKQFAAGPGCITSAATSPKGGGGGSRTGACAQGSVDSRAAFVPPATEEPEIAAGWYHIRGLCPRMKLLEYVDCTWYRVEIFHNSRPCTLETWQCCFYSFL